MSMTTAVGIAPSPFRIIEPVTTRLNGNVLWVVLGLLAVTAMGAVMAWAPGKGGYGPKDGRDSAQVTPVRPQRPVLPVRPVLATPAVATVSGVQGPPAAPAIAFEERRAVRSRGLRGAARSGRGGEGSGEAAYARALISRLMVDDRPANIRDTLPAIAADPSAGTAPVETAATTVTASVGSGGAGALTGERDAERERAAFLGTRRTQGEAAIAPSVDAPVTAYELEAGTVIPAALETTVNSDLPGTIVAQVSRDVYDSRTESTVLVPKGTRLIGAYDDRIVPGQSRVLVAWTRMVFPDGRSVRLPGVEGVDAAGSAGVEGSVNDHLGHVFATAALMSGLSAGAQLSQPEAGGGTYAAPSAGQVAAGALGQEMSSVGMEVVRQGLSVKPTITVRGGAAVQVMLTQDVVFTTGYVDGRQ